MDGLLDSLFTDEVRQHAYHHFFDLIDTVIKPEVRKKLGRSDFLILAEHYIVRDSPAIKITATDIDHSGAVFICFDADLSTYAVGQTTLGNSDFLAGVNCKNEAATEVVGQLNGIIQRWS